MSWNAIYLGVEIHSFIIINSILFLSLLFPNRLPLQFYPLYFTLKQWNVVSFLYASRASSDHRIILKSLSWVNVERVNERERKGVWKGDLFCSWPHHGIMLSHHHQWYKLCNTNTLTFSSFHRAKVKAYNENSQVCFLLFIRQSPVTRHPYLSFSIDENCFYVKTSLCIIFILLLLKNVFHFSRIPLGCRAQTSFI